MPYPELSIITPTHNRPLLLDRAIESTLQQTFLNWEMVIIDDSTNNETKDNIGKYSDESRIIYVKNNQNKGVAFSRNRGLDLARGEWILFLDDDDFFINSEIIRDALRFIHKNNNSWFFGSNLNETNQRITKVMKVKESYNLARDSLFGWSIRGDGAHFIKKDLIDPLRFSERDASEWRFWYELSKKSDFNLIPKDIMYCEYLADGLTKQGGVRTERAIHIEQIKEMSKNIKTWKYLLLITSRLLRSYIPIKIIRSSFF